MQRSTRSFLRNRFATVRMTTRLLDPASTYQCLLPKTRGLTRRIVVDNILTLENCSLSLFPVPFTMLIDLTLQSFYSLTQESNPTCIIVCFTCVQRSTRSFLRNRFGTVRMTTIHLVETSRRYKSLLLSTRGLTRRIVVDNILTLVIIVLSSIPRPLYHVN